MIVYVGGGFLDYARNDGKLLYNLQFIYYILDLSYFL